jgi:hypothetical protein
MFAPVAKTPMMAVPAVPARVAAVEKPSAAATSHSAPAGLVTADLARLRLRQVPGEQPALNHQEHVRDERDKQGLT